MPEQRRVDLGQSGRSIDARHRERDDGTFGRDLRRPIGRVGLPRQMLRVDSPKPIRTSATSTEAPAAVTSKSSRGSARPGTTSRLTPLVETLLRNGRGNGGKPSPAMNTSSTVARMLRSCSPARFASSLCSRGCHSSTSRPPTTSTRSVFDALRGWKKRQSEERLADHQTRRITFHGLRHTHAAVMLTDWDIVWVSRRPGHATIEITDRT